MSLMRRTELKRTGELKRSPLRRRPKVRAETVAERQARFVWGTPKAGPCECGCSRFSMHLEHHHVVEQKHIKAENRWDLLFDPRNGMRLHEHCHSVHTSAIRRIKIEYVPIAAMQFAVELLGEARARDYLDRYYDCSVTL